jgi:hypothetical protein
VRAGDTLVTIAAHFETTLKKLLSVNPQIVQEDKILPGDKSMCVAVCAPIQRLLLDSFFVSCIYLPTTTNITVELPV